MTKMVVAYTTVLAMRLERNGTDSRDTLEMELTQHCDGLDVGIWKLKKITKTSGLSKWTHCGIKMK